MVSFRNISLLVYICVAPVLAFVPLKRNYRTVPWSAAAARLEVLSREASPTPSRKGWFHDPSSSTQLVAFRGTTTDNQQQSTNMFDGPMALTKERDACGVGFIANAKVGGEFGSHKILQQGLAALSCMEHRGGCGGDGVSGDGAGIMTAIPWRLFEEYRSDACPWPGVGMIFLPQNPDRREATMRLIEKVCCANELEFMGWRQVPVAPEVLGPMARAVMPTIWQFFVKTPARLSNDDKDRDGFERTLYLVRRRFDVERRLNHLVWDDDDGEVYVASFSSRTIVYKGMVQSAVLPVFYKDLTDERYTTKFVIYHRRYSTNTSPRWQLAQPMRVVGHNGEINTLLGNVNWIKAREAAKGLPIRTEVDLDKDDDTGVNDSTNDRGDISDLVDYYATENIVTMCNTQDVPSVLEPVVDLTRSDSANLDSVFELMCRSRHRAPCALMALVPAAYVNNPDLKNNPEITDFYKFHGGLLESWDGPALLVFSDGKSIGASLDRNGLRPARFSIDRGGTVYMMSETGVIPDLKEADIVEKGRLGPGQMVNVDLVTGEFKNNIQIKSEIASRKCFTGLFVRALTCTRTHINS
jgi:glutamate synthase (ferredoxin)